MTKIPIISIVDDDESVRESLQSLLRSAGFAAVVFASAEEFLNSEHLHHTDCLILDIRMPGMSGLELQRQMAASGNKTPVIFITAHGDQETRTQALKNGAVEYLLKPFSEDSLLNAIGMARSSN
jgi:FixJ family two-component response regulator